MIHFCLASGKSRSFENFKSELAEFGLSEEDLEVCMTMAQDLAEIHNAAFGPSVDIDIWLLKGHPTKAEIAYYQPEDDRSAEHYAVRLRPGAAESMRRMAEHISLLVSNGKGGFEDPAESPKPAPRQIIFSIAAHEVRHRVQMFLDDGRFTPKSESRITDPIIREIVRRFASEKHEIMFSDGTVGAVEWRADPEEFDAYVVEAIVLNKWVLGGNPDDLADLLFSAPS